MMLIKCEYHTHWLLTQNLIKLIKNKKIPREYGRKSHIGNYLILLNKVNSKAAVRYSVVRHGRPGVSN
jgi:hypothetical protein